ncbi:MAG: TetR/AcrR family transcriptional regulator [Halanaerobiales bacterium]|nr:TetR/AcrR family transcriptional regulator [Halanaerobiales bacterium]
MNKNFLKLSLEKQNKILRAAYQEFTKNNYKYASTNKIIKEAGIGKGTLFYYFNSKKELFKYLIEEGIDFILSEYLNKIDQDIDDFIEKYKKVGKLKMKAYIKKPYIFNFFGTLYINNDDIKFKEQIKQLTNLKKNVFSKLYENNDESLFRKDLPPNKVYKLIQWSLDGYEKELVDSLKDKNLSSIDFDPYWDDFYDFLNLLKTIYYEEEES